MQPACTMTTQNSKIRLISSIALKSRLITYTVNSGCDTFQEAPADFFLIFFDFFFFLGGGGSGAPGMGARPAGFAFHTS